MNIRKYFMVLLAAAMSQAASGSEDPACRNIDNAYITHTAEQLRTIAASCRHEPIARLYYNRAYHADLVEEARIKSNVLSFSLTAGSSDLNSNDSRDFEPYRLYIQFIEELAPIWFSNTADRVAFLNVEYEHQGELADLRLQGYEQIADYMERQHNNKR